MTQEENPSGPSMEEQALKLHDTLKALQEPKGYYFNQEEGFTMPLLEQLLVTKAKYGYMACPCRIANGDYKLDKDIICPCEYREKDVQEYNACFCGLYVSKAWNDGDVPHVQVLERRPPEKIIF